MHKTESTPNLFTPVFRGRFQKPDDYWDSWDPDYEQWTQKRKRRKCSEDETYVEDVFGSFDPSGFALFDEIPKNDRRYDQFETGHLEPHTWPLYADDPATTDTTSGLDASVATALLTNCDVRQNESELPSHISEDPQQPRLDNLDSQGYYKNDVPNMDFASHSDIAKGQWSDSGRTSQKRSGSERSQEDGVDGVAQRPEVTEHILVELNDISEFRKDERLLSHIVEYRDKISFPLGEGGRELLRACLNLKGCKGRQLQGASVPTLLNLAHKWDLWDVAIRIKLERQTGKLCPAHEAFVRFKATQSQMRKYIRKEYMLTERDPTGKISQIYYDETRKIKLGKDGREALRAKLRRLHDKHASRMDELLAQHGFKYSELRNATVQQLSRMAFVCNLWDQVVNACRSQEEKKDGKKWKKTSSTGPREVKLPFSLLNGDTTLTTNEDGEMTNEDVRRTMEAVSALLQQSFGDEPEQIDNHVLNPSMFNDYVSEPPCDIFKVKTELLDQANPERLFAQPASYAPPYTQVAFDTNEGGFF